VPRRRWDEWLEKMVTMYAEQEKGEVPNVFRSVIHVEQGKGKKAETIWMHYAIMLVQLRRTQGIVDSMASRPVPFS
jgi:hypothetical protein